MSEETVRLGWLALAGIVVSLACVRDEPADTGTGTFQVTWTGADTGKLSAPAVAEWCDSLDLLELRAVQGDTGIAVALYPSESRTTRDSVPRGDYPVFPPTKAGSTRPSAAIALRWFAETSIRGFRGDSGAVAVEPTGPGTGRFSAHLRSATDGSRLRVTGSFAGLTVTPAPPGCAGDPPDEEEEDEEPGG